MPQTVSNARTVIHVKNVQETRFSMKEKKHVYVEKGISCKIINVRGRGVAMESRKTRSSVHVWLGSSWMIRDAKTALRIAQSAQMEANVPSANFLSNSLKQESASSPVGLRRLLTGKKGFA